METVLDHERELAALALCELGRIDGMAIYGPPDAAARTGIVSFAVASGNGTIDCHILGELVTRQGIAMRTGGHCAYPLMRRLGVEGTLRISVYVYNDEDDLLKFVRVLKNCIAHCAP